MTPKEKAKELVYKFYPSVQWKLGQEDCLDRAKRCALIAVDEILNAITFNMYDEESYNIEDKYWQEVKQQIEKL
jgi:hypothetical protein